MCHSEGRWRWAGASRVGWHRGARDVAADEDYAPGWREGVWSGHARARLRVGQREHDRQASAHRYVHRQPLPIPKTLTRLSCAEVLPLGCLSDSDIGREGVSALRVCSTYSNRVSTYVRIGLLVTSSSADFRLVGAPRRSRRVEPSLRRYAP